MKDLEIKFRKLEIDECRGPALADPGSSRRGQCQQGSGYNRFN